jgi:hypothetical protein
MTPRTPARAMAASRSTTAKMVLGRTVTVTFQELSGVEQVLIR